MELGSLSQQPCSIRDVAGEHCIACLSRVTASRKVLPAYFTCSILADIAAQPLQCMRHVCIAAMQCMAIPPAAITSTRNDKLKGTATAQASAEPAAAAAVASYWDLPHPGPAPEWAAPTDRPDQALPEADEPVTADVHDASAKPAADASNLDMRTGEAADIEVTVAEQDVNKKTPDEHVKDHSNMRTSVEVQDSTHSSGDVVPVQVFAADGCKADKGETEIKKTKSVSPANWLKERDILPADGNAHTEKDESIAYTVPVQVTAGVTSKDNEEAVKAAGGSSLAVNWLNQKEGNAADNVGHGGDGVINVYVHQDLL